MVKINSVWVIENRDIKIISEDYYFDCELFKKLIKKVFFFCPFYIFASGDQVSFVVWWLDLLKMYHSIILTFIKRKNILLIESVSKRIYEFQ